MKTGGGVASKVWEIIRIASMLIKKGISMKKILLELSLMIKERKITGKAHRNHKLHHENHHGGGGAAREYKFTTTNNNKTAIMKKNKKNSIYMASCESSCGEISMEAVDRVLERITRIQNNNNNKEDIEEFDGFEEGNTIHEHVDEAAEDFIKTFYSQLRLQPSTPLHI